jgi:hypothetical protein
MKIGFAILASLTMALISLGAAAQGVVGGAQEGSANGAAVAGPVGAVVGGAVGAVTGGVAGLLGIDQMPRFREYVLREQHVSYPYSDDFRAGAVLHLDDVTYYPVPPEFGVDPAYRYTIINNHAVIVDPRTRTIIQVMD